MQEIKCKEEKEAIEFLIEKHELKDDEFNIDDNGHVKLLKKRKEKKN